MSKVVKSPAGESIEIVNDDDWLTLTGATTDFGLRIWNGQKGGPSEKAVVIRALWEHGSFTDPKSGRAPKLVADYVFSTSGQRMAATNIANSFRDPLNAPAVERDIKGKRTYSIKLVALPDTWYRKLLADIPEPEAEPEPEPETEPEPISSNGVAEEFTEAEWDAVQLDAPTVYDSPPSLELQIANQVAMSLLTTVVEIISAGSADVSKLSVSRKMAADLDAMQILLNQRLEENTKLRKQIREAVEQVNVLRYERDGLRTRLRATEHNLTQVLKGETAQAVNSEIHKHIDQIMRTTPTQKGV